MDPPETASVAAAASSPSRRTPPRPPSPALASATPARPASTNASSTPAAPPAAGNGGSTLQLDMSINAAVCALVHHLVSPLAAHYSHQQLMGLRSALNEALTKAYEPSWNESNPHSGSGLRSLIADQIHGLPPILKAAAKEKGIDTAVWTKAIATLRKRKDDADSDMWEVWCDPGMVVWRWGGWGWDDPEFDPVKTRRETYHVIWQAAAPASGPAPEATSPVMATPARSKAIPIRAPSLLHIPPTPSPAPSTASVASSAAPAPIAAPRSPSPSLLPAADINAAPPFRSHSRTNSSTDVRRSHSRNASFTRGSGHKGQGSTSSNSSDSSDNGSHTQLLTPASRPGSADLFPESNGEKDDISRGRDPSPSRNEPTVTPYDGGNVTVLGGGTKLGGSRPSSVMSNHRTRSPSVSIASRALGNAVGPNSNGGAPPSSPRKPRTRRRIIPTHIGYFGQPGVGAPVMGAFGAGGAALKHGPPYQWPHGQPGAAGGVGVGLAPPPVGGIGIANQMGMAHAMSKRMV